MGLLNEVTQVISRQLNVNIRKLTIETTDGIFEGKIQLYVHDVDDVRSICDNLKLIQNIKQVTRIEGIVLYGCSFIRFSFNASTSS